MFFSYLIKTQDMIHLPSDVTHKHYLSLCVIPMYDSFGCTRNSYVIHSFSFVIHLTVSVILTDSFVFYAILSHKAHFHLWVFLWIIWFYMWFLNNWLILHMLWKTCFWLCFLCMIHSFPGVIFTPFIFLHICCFAYVIQKHSYAFTHLT